VLQWSAPSSDGGSAITNYKVYRGTSSGTETLLTTVGNVSTYTDSSAVNGTTYWYKVSAVNGVGEGSDRKSGVEAEWGVQGERWALVFGGETCGRGILALQWSAPSSDGGSAITNYKVYRGTSSGTETLLTTVGNVSTYTDSSAVNGTTYWYKVSAVNGVGEG